MTIFKTMAGGRNAGSTFYKKLQEASAEARKNKNWITEPIKEELLKDIGKKFGESMKKAIEKTTVGEEEFMRYFMGDFDLKPELHRPEGIDCKLEVKARFGFETGYIAKEKIRYMHHRKKRIDKKWSKNPDYYITRSVKRDYMPIIQTAVA